MLDIPMEALWYCFLSLNFHPLLFSIPVVTCSRLPDGIWGFCSPISLPQTECKLECRTSCQFLPLPFAFSLSGVLQWWEYFYTWLGIVNGFLTAPDDHLRQHASERTNGHALSFIEKGFLTPCGFTLSGVNICFVQKLLEKGRQSKSWKLIVQ